jgi:hypothetical protein
MLQVAYFLFIIVTWREWPVEVGPYTLEECHSVKEFLDRRGYEVSGCEVMSVPQEDAVKLEIPHIPTEENTK